MSHGCHNREPYKTGYVAPDGMYFNGVNGGEHTFIFKSRFIPHTLSRSCKHPERAKDPGCVGCIWLTKIDDAELPEKENAST